MKRWRHLQYYDMNTKFREILSVEGKRKFENKKLLQGCTIPGRQISLATKFFICGSSGWNLLRVVLLAPRILEWI